MHCQFGTCTAEPPNYGGSQIEPTIRDHGWVRAGSKACARHAGATAGVDARLMALARVVELVRHDRLKNDCPSGMRVRVPPRVSMPPVTSHPLKVVFAQGCARPAALRA